MNRHQSEPKNNTVKTFRSFLRFLSRKPQTPELAVLSLAFLVIGIIIYTLFPYPFTFPDSGAYLLGASRDQFNIFRPMGYSHYLQFLHGIHAGIGFVFCFTYTLHAVSVLLFLYTLKYLWDFTSKLLFYSLCLCAVAAPRFLFASNFIMSDSLFSSLTLLFLTSAIWLIYRRKWGIIVLLLALFAALYQVRYSGMFYLLVPVYALYIVFTPGNRIRKTVAVLLPLVCFLFLYFHNKTEYYRQTGVNISSGFSGWQLVSNASVLFPEAKEIPLARFDDPGLKTLHTYMQSVPDSVFDDRYALGTSYMWNNDLPYKQFLFLYMQYTRQSYPQAWVTCGDLYGKYALELIKIYPGKFFSRFLLPSFTSTFKFFDITEYSNPFVNDPVYNNYYRLSLDKYQHTCSLFGHLNTPRKIIHYFYWILLSVALFYFIAKTRLSRFRDKRWLSASLLLLFLLTHAGASFLASPNVSWRYTMPLFLPSLAFIFYNLEDFIRNTTGKEKKPSFK